MDLFFKICQYLLVAILVFVTLEICVDEEARVNKNFQPSHSKIVIASVLFPVTLIVLLVQAVTQIRRK